MNLFTPGPVNLSEEAVSGLCEPVIHHRSDTFRSLLGSLTEGLKAAFQTTDGIAVLTSSGTGAMEAVVANLFKAGDHVLVPVGGKFGRRWTEICGAYGVNVTSLDLLPGQSVTPEMTIETLSRAGRTDGVLLCQCETSTGSLTDLRSVCEAVAQIGRRKGQHILACVDCVTSFCVDELRKDQWGIDCAIAASQKGLLSPPGLSFVCLNPEALNRLERSGQPRYYFDLRKYLGHGSESPFTPAVCLIRAVNDSLRAILELGLENVWKANRAAASGIKMILDEAGFDTLATAQSSAVLAFWVDDPLGDRIARMLSDRHGIMVAHGQGDLRGKILRISPIGKSRGEIMHFAESFESTLNLLGRAFSLHKIRESLEKTLEGAALWE